MPIASARLTKSITGSPRWVSRDAFGPGVAILARASSVRRIAYSRFATTITVTPTFSRAIVQSA
jgi:hypothetical protein